MKRRIRPKSRAYFQRQLFSDLPKLILERTPACDMIDAIIGNMTHKKLVCKTVQSYGMRVNQIPTLKAALRTLHGASGAAFGAVGTALLHSDTFKMRSISMDPRERIYVPLLLLRHLQHIGALPERLGAQRAPVYRALDIICRAYEHADYVRTFRHWYGPHSKARKLRTETQKAEAIHMRSMKPQASRS